MHQWKLLFIWPVYCTRGSCLEYPNFKSRSLPTHETSLISMATLSLPQLYDKAQKKITTMHWCSVLHWARTHGNKNNQSLEPFHLSFWEAACMKQHKQLPSASVYQYGHYISQSPPQLQQNKGSSREEGWHGAGATCRLSLHLLWSTLDPTPILSQRNSIRPAPRVSLTLTFYPGTCWRCEK